MSHSDEPVSGKPAIGKTTIDKPAIDKPAVDKPAVDTPVSSGALSSESLVDEPLAGEPQTGEPQTDVFATVKPAADERRVDAPPAADGAIARSARSAPPAPASASASADAAVAATAITPAGSVVPAMPADRFTRTELHPHDPAWADEARAEIARLTAALGEAVVCIEHIGSTSIPRIAAKPIIDLLPLASSLAAVDARANDVIALGYDWRGEYGIPGRRFCTRTDPATGRRLFNVHIFASDSPDTARHVAFRDYLRAHPDEARAYEAEKQRAAALHPADVFAYNDEKNDWIKACEHRALAWWPPRRACAEK